MKKLYKFKFHCDVCNQYYETGFIFSDDPILCPVDSTHTISEIIEMDSIITENISNIWNIPYTQPYTKPTDTYDYFTGRCDDRTTKTTYGTGNKMYVNHMANSGITKHELYFDVNCEENKTYIHNGWVLYNNCLGESITFEIIPEVNPIITGLTGTNYKLYDGYMIIPASGDGDIDLADPNNLKPLECLVSQVTKQKYPGYWDADWDSVNQKWINLQPNANGTGNFNLIADIGADIVLDRFANAITLVGSGKYFTNTFSTAQLGVGFRIKITIETDDTHDFQIAVNLFLARRHTL